MKYQLIANTSEQHAADCIVFAVHPSEPLTDNARQFDQSHDNILSSALKTGDLERQKSLLLYTPSAPCRRVLLLSIGNRSELDDNQFQQLIMTMTNALKNASVEQVICYLEDIPVKQRDLAWKTRQAVITIDNTLYRFDELKSDVSDPVSWQQCSFTLPADQTVESALNIGTAIANGMTLCKNLANRPGNICTPTHLAEQAEQLADQYSTLKTTVLGETEMEELGMNALLSVGRGSAQESKLVIMEYMNGPTDRKPIALIGKGVTMDTGGISLKPGLAMDEMKFDMGGAASVFGVVRACLELDLPINLVAIVPTVQNMPGSRATCPGDIVTSLSGKTIEILNTDAEGRLILCDAITYSLRYQPDAIIDVATLTGACVVALGHITSAIFSDNPSLTDALMAAAGETTDHAWPMPVNDDYQDQLNSNFADMANIGNQGRAGGAIIAACFLKRFTDDLPWAHLDIAGTASISGKNKGATGRPVPLLTQFLIDRAGS